MATFTPLAGVVEEIHEAFPPVFLELVTSNDIAHQSVYFHVDSPSIRGLIVKFISSEQCEVVWYRLTGYFPSGCSSGRSRAKSTFLVILYLSGICRAAYDQSVEGYTGKLAEVQTVSEVKA
jgi:hypothetical protein